MRREAGAPGDRERSRDALCLLVLLGAAAALRFWGLEMGLPHPETRPDETQILDHLALAAQGDFDFDWVVYPHAYVYLHWLWAEFVVRVQSLVGASSIADPAMQWKIAPDRSYATGRALTAVLGTATVAVVFAMARRAGGRVAAFLAAALVAGCLLHVRESHALKPDVAVGLFGTLAIAGAAHLARERSVRAGVIAGIGVGAAAAAKYNGLIAALPVAVGAWWASEAKGLARWLPLPLVVAGGAALAFFALTSPFLLLDPATWEFWLPTIRTVLPGWAGEPGGLGGAGAAGATFDASALAGPRAPEWTLAYGALGRVAYHGLFSLPNGLGWLPTLFAPFAVVWGLRSKDWSLRLAAVFCIAWFASIFAIQVYLSRYVTPVVPALALLEGGCAAAAIDRWAPQRRTLAALLVGVALVAPSTASSIRFDRLVARTDTRVQAGRWLADNTAPGSRIAVHGTRFWNWGAPRVPAGRRDVRPPERLDARRLDYLVTHDHRLFWSSVDPAWMARNGGALDLLVEFDPRSGAEGEAVFELNDAFYVPFAGFSGVSAPGPHVRVYRVR